MKAFLCLIGLVSLPLANAQTDFKLTGDALVRGYFKNSTGNSGEQAFNQFFRLNLTAKPDANVTAKVGAVLSSSSWEGDNHKSIQSGGTAVGGVHTDGFSNEDAVRLDHAVLEYKVETWILSAGRHQVSTPGNFLTSDDRRDRLQVLKIRPNYDVIAFAYDKRAEGALNNGRDDLDMYSANYYGQLNPTFKYALQTAYWSAKKYDNATSGVNAPNLDEVKQVSPQINTVVSGVSVDFYYTLLFGGSVLYKNDHHSFAFKLSKEIESYKLEYQSMLTIRGGLIAGGFDSLSSIVNNSPDNLQSSIKVKTVGFGLGLIKKNESLHMLRLSKQFNPKFKASIGGGYGEFVTGTTKDKVVLADTTATYDLSSFFKVELAYGKMFDDIKDHAGSLTLKANF